MMLECSVFFAELQDVDLIDLSPFLFLVCLFVGGNLDFHIGIDALARF